MVSSVSIIVRLIRSFLWAMSSSNATARARFDSVEVVFVCTFARFEWEVGVLDGPSRGFEREMDVAAEVCFEILPERVTLAGSDGMVAVWQAR